MFTANTFSFWIWIENQQSSRLYNFVDKIDQLAGIGPTIIYYYVIQSVRVYYFKPIGVVQIGVVIEGIEANLLNRTCDF
jgi:hypothetical protein